jgi:hypothetical protein
MLETFALSVWSNAETTREPLKVFYEILALGLLSAVAANCCIFL